MTKKVVRISERVRIGASSLEAMLRIIDSCLVAHKREMLHVFVVDGVCAERVM